MKKALEGNLGYKGERGYSNYELAVKNGYQGTEQEWLANFGVDFTLCKMKSEFAVIIDNVASEEMSKLISYPTGFDVNNCVVTSLEIKEDNTYFYKTTKDGEDNNKYDVRVELKENGVVVWCNYSFVEEQPLYFKLVLMKIS